MGGRAFDARLVQKRAALRAWQSGPHAYKEGRNNRKGRPLSNTDSFIDEVTEEVRRDHLFKLARRYGWIAVVVVLGIVGGAAWNEWQKASRKASAERLGDAVLAALDLPESAARTAALRSIDATPDQRAFLQMLTAAEAGALGDAQARAQAGADLEALASNGSLPLAWRDLAAFRRAAVPGLMDDIAARKATLGALSEAGRPYRLLALEQLALLALDEGDTAAAIDGLRVISADTAAPAGLRNRASQMMVVLGAEATGPNN